MTDLSGRVPSLICNNCGEAVERKDDGRFWHVEDYAGYEQCRLYAEPVKEYA